MLSPSTRAALVACVLAPVLALAPPSVREARTEEGVRDLRDEMAGVAAQIASYVRSQKKGNSVVVGSFTVDSPRLQANGGPQIASTLMFQLKSMGVNVTLDSPIGVKGEYGVSEEGGKPAVAIYPKLIDEKNPSVPRLDPIKVTYRRELFSLLQPTASFDHELSEKDVDALLAKYFKDKPPPPTIDPVEKTQVKGGPYAVEVLVNDKPCPVSDDGGFAFCTLKRGDVYAVRLYNTSKYEAAAGVTIDGLSMFAFSQLTYKDGDFKGEPRFGNVLVPPGGHLDVKGWFINGEVTKEFKVTSLADSAVSKVNDKAGLIKDESNVGVIHVTFSVCWQQGQEPPPGAGDSPQSAGPDDATGFGSPVTVKWEEVARMIGPPRDSIAVRYNK